MFVHRAHAANVVYSWCWMVCQYQCYFYHIDGRLSSTAAGVAMKRSESARDFSLANMKISRSQRNPAKMSPPSHLRCVSDGDYDLLSPVGRNPGHVTTQATPCAYVNVELDSKSQDAERRRNHKGSVPETRNAVYTKPLATSVPSTPLFGQRRPLNRSSSSGE